MPFPAVVDLDDIAAGRGGFKIQGQTTRDFAGSSVSSAGDINGDGIDDLIIGAPGGSARPGAAYVVFGTNGGLASPLDLDDIAEGTGGFKMVGDALDEAGTSVSNAGDVNGDGIDDLIVGAPGAGEGAAYVVFGRTDDFDSPVDLADVAAGRGGFQIGGGEGFSEAGFSVSNAGDVNDDGIDDLIIGDPGGGPNGAAYVVFGRTGRFDSPVDLDDLAAGEGGFKIVGAGDGDAAGVSVSAAGDINGDGLDDLIVGAENNESDGRYSYSVGSAYVVFGRGRGFSSPVDLADVAEGRGGFVIPGDRTSNFSAGLTVSAAGDVNGDGIDDLVLGAPINGSGGSFAGAAYVVFGRTGRFGASVDLDAIAAGNGGFRILGQANDLAGSSVSNAGDINGDGIGDLIVGAPSAEGGGAAYVVFGRNGGFDSPIDLADVADGRGGFRIQGQDAGDGAGISVSAAGDVNQDGIDDLIVGADGDDDGGNSAGAAYVIYGQRDTLFTSGDDTRDLNDFDLSNFSRAEATRALAGNDTVTLSETQNLGVPFFGMDGSDVITGSSSGDEVSGGAGMDRLVLRGGDDVGFGNAANDRLFGGGGDDRLDGSFGNDRIYGGASDDWTIGDAGEDLVLGGSGDDRLFGGAGNDVLDGGGDSDRLTGNAGADLFAFGLDGPYPDGSGAASPNVITDYVDGLDRFLIDTSGTGASDFASDIRLAQVGADVRLTIRDDGGVVQAVALILTEDVANIRAGDFLFVA